MPLARTSGLKFSSPTEPGWAMLGGNGRSGLPGATIRLGVKATRLASNENVPSGRSVAGRAASPALGSLLEKFTPRRSASAWSLASRMMYHAGFRPEGVFTAPLKSGRVIVPRGVPLGTLTDVSASIGMSNLPDFSSRTGPANSGSVSESAGGNCEISTFVPVDAKSGIRLHPGPGPFAAGPGPSPATRWALPWSCAYATAGKSMIAATAIAGTHANVLRHKLLPLQLG